MVAATVAPAEADEMLREALAAGAAQALRVEPASWTAGPAPAAGRAARDPGQGKHRDHGGQHAGGRGAADQGPRCPPVPARPRDLPGPTGTALPRTLELTGALVQRTPPTVVGPLPPDQAASDLLAYLRRCGYLGADDPD